MEKDIKNKIHSAVIDAILKIKPQNKEEALIQEEYLLNIHKIFENYEQLRPIFLKYFHKEMQRKKMELTLNETLNRVEFAEDNLKRRSEESWEK